MVKFTILWSLVHLLALVIGNWLDSYDVAAADTISGSENGIMHEVDDISYFYPHHRKARLLSSDTLRNPLYAFKSRITGNTSRPLCYESRESRMQSLKGSFTDISYRTARYWNLSCPLELSKWSCIHQAVNDSHAQYAANLHFVPSDCELLTREEMLPYLSLHTNLSIVFFGNSLTRQVLIGLLCDMHAMGLITSLHVEWTSCASNQQYPCHGTMHCIQCGEHSGTYNFTAYFPGGGSFRYVAAERATEILANDSSRIDFVVGQRWGSSVDEGAMETFYEFRKRNSLPIPKFIAYFSFGSHFVNGGTLYDDGARYPSGKYNETFLSQLRHKKGTVPCLRYVGEDQLWSDSSHPIYTKWQPEGYVWLAGTNKLGEAKVGTAVGKFGDCQHFCMPGPADEIGRGLLQFILAVFTF